MVSDKIDHLPDLERACTACDGSGGWREDGKWHRCPECHGDGFFPTDYGQQVIDLMRRNFYKIAPAR